jgi:hypothetical protein
VLYRIVIVIVMLRVEGVVDPGLLLRRKIQTNFDLTHSGLINRLVEFFLFLTLTSNNPLLGNVRGIKYRY